MKKIFFASEGKYTFILNSIFLVLYSIMKVNDEYIVNIEKLSNLGTGIARVDGQVVFVENACPEDELKIKITKVNKNFSNAEVIEIINPSPHRITPFCPMHKICGSCQLQFIDYEFQLLLKKQMVEDTMKTIGHIDTPVNNPMPSPEIKAFRHKIQCPVSQTKVSKKLLAGYYKPQSHEIINIKYCPIQPEICDKIIDFVRNKAPEYNISGYGEKKHSGDLRHIVIRCSAHNNKCLVTLVVNSSKSHDKYNKLSHSIFNEFEDVSGVCININNKKTNVILGDKTECVCGEDFIEEKILDKTFNIGVDTFFQVNPKSAENIFKYVKNEISKSGNPTVLDAYAGIAAFGIVVSDACKHVVSVEENKNSIQKAYEALKINNISNIELHAKDTTKYLKSIKKKFDITILDPPRKGCTIESLKETLKHTREKIIYVSCNPATLARDLKYLCEKGCTVESIQPFDMFCHTFHIETVAIINI